MTEMIHVTEGEDIGNLLKNQLPKYEIINFGQEVWVYLINWSFINH